MQLIVTRISSGHKYFGNDYASKIEVDTVHASDDVTGTAVTFDTQPGRFHLRYSISFDDIAEAVVRPEAKVQA